MLGIAFSANAGGIATVIGTPPNSVLIGLLENEYQIQISFVKWMMIGLPFALILITIIYISSFYYTNIIILTIFKSFFKLRFIIFNLCPRFMMTN